VGYKKSGLWNYEIGTGFILILYSQSITQAPFADKSRFGAMILQK
jgi:hypothetical protein